MTEKRIFKYGGNLVSNPKNKTYHVCGEEVGTSYKCSMGICKECNEIKRYKGC